MANSAGLHEPADQLSPQTIDRHRAITSLQEELEAIDWYDQRVNATADGELAAVLAHNRDEEKEHAAMTLEWLRRRDPTLDQHLRTYLFTTEPVTEVEAEAEASDGDDERRGLPVHRQPERRDAMNHLLRSHAPITESGWDQIDEEGRQRLVPALATRKLVDFSGPLGWQHSSTNLGRTKPIEGTPAQGLVARQRQVLALVELRADFSGLPGGTARR